MLTNIASAYAVYYNTAVVTLLFSILQCGIYVLLLAALARWVELIRRKYGGKFQTKLFNVEEYTFFQYIIPTIIYPTALLIWNFVAQIRFWQTMSATTLIFYVTVNCLFAAVIIGKKTVYRKSIFRRV